MMYSKESLNKLLLLITEISDDPQHKWFNEELCKKFGSSPAAFEDFPSFLIHLKKNYRLKANEFFKNIPDQDLKNELLKDNVEMQWYQTTHDAERFLLYTFYQMENLLNYYCTKTDAFNVINRNKNFYQYSFGPIHIVCYDKFFDYKTGEKKEIHKVTPIYAKIAYWILHSKRENWYSSSSYNISNLIKIRNKNSHRSSTTPPENKVLETLDLLKKQDISSLSFYISILKEMIKTIEEIGKEPISILPTEHKSNSNGGLKILGKIDLPVRNKR